ncbi:MAG: NAD-dependent epimerase/dehydratase family protein, partial [Lysobacter sp.]|nr:NAD-dependent epimerase/dehydratase family protein [Lysobacter sp.]
HLLEAVRACPSVRAVVNATTDKVYAPPDAPRAHAESDPLGGHDPYSTSKACAELVSACYRSSYFAVGDRVRLATARAGNVVGGGDWSQDRLVPDAVRAVQTGLPLRLRNPRATRPWQHVLEPLSGYLRIGQLLLDGSLEGDSWNFGPAADATLAVGDVISRLQRDWPQLKVKHDDGEHPHEAPLLALDSRRAMRELGWAPVWDADATLGRTARWYRELSAKGTVSTYDDLAAFAKDAAAAGVGWT